MSLDAGLSRAGAVADLLKLARFGAMWLGRDALEKRVAFVFLAVQATGIVKDVHERRKAAPAAAGSHWAEMSRNLFVAGDLALFALFVHNVRPVIPSKWVPPVSHGLYTCFVGGAVCNLAHASTRDSFDSKAVIKAASLLLYVGMETVAAVEGRFRPQRALVGLGTTCVSLYFRDWDDGLKMVRLK